MQETDLEASSSRRVTPRHLAQWRRLIEEEGWTTAAVASKSGFQARTIRAALDRDDARLDLRSAHRERLRGAMQAHDDALLAEAERFSQSLSWPPRFSLIPRPEDSLARKRQQALLMHTKGLGVPRAVKRWEALVQAYGRVLTKLEESLREAVTAKQTLDVLGGVTRLLSIADILARGVPVVSLGYSAQGGALRDGAYQILSDVQSLDDPRAKSACRDIERMEKDLQHWGEVSDLKALHQEWKGLHDQLVGLMEDIVLRRLPPGSCDWCPAEQHK